MAMYIAMNIRTDIRVLTPSIKVLERETRVHGPRICKLLESGKASNNGWTFDEAVEMENPGQPEKAGSCPIKYYF